MDLREEICREHSKSQCNRIVEWVGHSQKRFDQLFDLFLNDEYRVVQRSAWPLSYCVQGHPRFIHKHFDKLFTKLALPDQPRAVKRNSLRLLQGLEIPGRYHGFLMDLCFRSIAAPAEPAAVKAFSLSILHDLSGTYPEILPELKMVIRERWDMETPAFRSRAKKILPVE